MHELHLHFISRPEDPFDSIRVECIIQNRPADNNTLELAEVAVLGIPSSLPAIVVNNSMVTSGYKEKPISYMASDIIEYLSPLCI